MGGSSVGVVRTCVRRPRARPATEIYSTAPTPPGPTRQTPSARPGERVGETAETRFREAPPDHGCAKSCNIRARLPMFVGVLGHTRLIVRLRAGYMKRAGRFSRDWMLCPM